MSPRRTHTASDVVLDINRADRTGLEEAVLCARKSADQIARILDRVRAGKRPVLMTRLSPEQVRRIPPAHRRRIDYDPISLTGFYNGRPQIHVRGTVAVVTAGTSDVPVAREASRTLLYYGVTVREMTDVGVAGLWRVLERLDDIRKADVVIVVAGMEGALPTVLGGLIAAPLIAVPTSVGYGVASNGATALHTMLSSCSSGLTVTNIDNGYGAACAAVRILRIRRGT
jgi:hypothetical protein